MVNDYAKVSKLNLFSPENEKKKRFVKSLDQFRREVREKVRNVFVMSLGLSDHKVLYNIASVLITFF